MTLLVILLSLNATVGTVLIVVQAIERRRRRELRKLTRESVAVQEPLQLYPRDIIVVEIPGAITHVMVNALNDHFGTILPGYKVIVLSDGMKMSVVRGWLNQIDMVKDRLTRGITH